MKLSAGEKLTLLALADVSKPPEKREIDIGFVKEAILSGHLWALEWEMPFLSEENETSADIVTETADILSMWRNIETSVDRLPIGEQERLRNEVGPYRLEFEGFDGNNDRHFSVAGFLVNNMDRFDELKGRPLNSHSQGSLSTYRRMLRKYEALMATKTTVSSFLLSADELLGIVKPNAA